MREETVLLAAVLTGASLCLRCASIKLDIVEDRLPDVIEQVRRRLTVIEDEGVCDDCQRRTTVYRLG